MAPAGILEECDVTCRSAACDGTRHQIVEVAEHIRLHGVSVWVEDRADAEQGARFVIELPAEAT